MSDDDGAGVGSNVTTSDTMTTSESLTDADGAVVLVAIVGSNVTVTEGSGVGSANVGSADVGSRVGSAVVGSCVDGEGEGGYVYVEGVGSEDSQSILVCI